MKIKAIRQIQPEEQLFYGQIPVIKTKIEANKEMNCIGTTHDGNPILQNGIRIFCVPKRLVEM